MTNLLELTRLITSARDELNEAIEFIIGPEPEPTAWELPVGTYDIPAEDWYCACWHDETGRRNGGYGHTGIDLNVDRPPWGDVDRGQPVFAVADGVVVGRAYSTSYLGSVVIAVSCYGVPLYVRYWHLANDDEFNERGVGDGVRCGEVLGHIGNYHLGSGGDHLHFDMARQEFGPHWWFTNHPEVEWLNPAFVLSLHIDSQMVEAMLAKK